MANEKKRAKVIEMIDDLYDDNGMAVVNLMTDYMSEKDWGHLYDRLDRDGAFREHPDCDIDILSEDGETSLLAYDSNTEQVYNYR